ncbi:PREDICTED: uncharacterized protein LOC109220776 [Nicotiana attenuata]|uniref:uncharacterized protein LOC109220776 n=1 Tax=Nicotiana attenuata TaxID=49451 RepID=UPI000905B606|nr:PREDICTED: uncharacterized protein LOC109220776 [Nicotiana attenuata]
MANFIVCQNKEKFKTTKHNLRLTFTQQTTVVETSDQLFPMNIFVLRPYDQLINKIDVDETELFNVIGEIVGFSEVKTHIQAGVSRKFMNVELEDDERNKLSATFWGEFVDEIVPHLLSSNDQPMVVVILLSVRDNYSERLTQTISQQSYSVSDELSKGVVQVKTIGELVESMEEGPCWIVANIENLELQRGWSYISCKKCQKKVDKLGNIYSCTNPKCKNEDYSAVNRYRLRVRVMDTTASVSLLLWDREAIFLIGKSANELKDGLLENTGGVDKPSYPMELNNILQRKFMFKVIVKSSNLRLQDEVYSVVKLTDDDHLIQKYSPAPPSDAFTDPDFNTDQGVDGENEFEGSTEDNELIDIANTPAKIGIPNAATVVEEDPNAQLSGNKIKRVFKKKKTT